MKHVTYKQEGGNDGYQYVVRVDGRARVNGCSRSEAQAYARRFRVELGLDPVTEQRTAPAALKHVTIEQAAAYLTMSNLGLDHLFNSPTCRRAEGKGRQPLKDSLHNTSVRSIQQATIEAICDGISEDEAERCWRDEFKSWRASVKKDMRDAGSYIVKHMAELGYQIIKPKQHATLAEQLRAEISAGKINQWQADRIAVEAGIIGGPGLPNSL